MLAVVTVLASVGMLWLGLELSRVHPLFTVLGAGLGVVLFFEGAMHLVDFIAAGTERRSVVSLLRTRRR